MTLGVWMRRTPCAPLIATNTRTAFHALDCTIGSPKPAVGKSTEQYRNCQIPPRSLSTHVGHARSIHAHARELPWDCVVLKRRYGDCRHRALGIGSVREFRDWPKLDAVA